MTRTDQPDRLENRWNLDLRRRAQKQLSELPEKIATAAAEFITGPLLDNPLRVGHPLRDEYEGQYSARRGRDWRIRYRLDEVPRPLSFSTSRTDPTPIAPDVA